MSDTTALVPLTISQIQTIRGGLDAQAYEDSPEEWRNDGYPLDPRKFAGYDASDPEVIEQIERIEEYDALDQHLAKFENALLVGTFAGAK